jgi:anti-sigma factor RsiW
MTKPNAPRKTPRAAGHSHEHGKGNCLKILRQLSAFIDDELTADLCREIRDHLGACPNCEDFVASLRQTVALCRHHPAPALSSAERARMRTMIFNAARGR